MDYNHQHCFEKALRCVWGVRDLRSPLCAVNIAEPSRTVLPNTSPTGGTNAVSLSQPSACLSCHPSSPPNPFPSRIADKAFYQQPDADIIGYVYVSPLLFCLGKLQRARPVCVAGSFSSLLLVGFKNVEVPWAVTRAGGASQGTAGPPSLQQMPIEIYSARRQLC